LVDCDAQAHAKVLQPAPAMEAAGHWIDRRLILWPGQATQGSRYWLSRAGQGGTSAAAERKLGGEDERLPLTLSSRPLPTALAQRFAFVSPGVLLQLPEATVSRVPALLQQGWTLVETDSTGRARRSTALQIAGVLDDRYASADALSDLGATIVRGRTAFKLWAPTASRVALCLYPGSGTPARQVLPLKRDPATGAWLASVPSDLSGNYFTYLVDVFVRGTGLVRNRVTDPYSLSLSTDSRRSWIGRLDAPALQPEGWATTPRPDKVKAATDLVVYELHVRDFSASDTSVSPANRGKYLAFTETAAKGMMHLRALAEAGLTDVHLLPVFDLASVPEQGCVTPDAAQLAAAAPDSEAQQAAVSATAAADCYNWGYDPYHYTAPEGSYASDAADGAVRILEFRRMVQELHRAGLRVGMDVVYNHTTASGQKERSVLDRIVPGYYQRLNAQGAVETSTCCDNTATEHRMMAKLMLDSAVVWARDHQIDSFRFDLMGHQPRAAMERLQQAVDRATGRHIHLIGEGWNFGEVANGARFVQAAQGRLAGSGIGSFSDRGRDAVRGGGCCDDAAATAQRQGWINGLHYDANPQARQAGVGTREELLRAADLVRVGLAGTLRDYRLTTHDGSVKPLSAIDYAGQGAGFASQPDEVVNYVENHDNQTLFDINVLKLPPGTSHEDRARVQVLGLAVTAFSQGIAYFHAGVEALRSKSLDRNSFDSGDWFNRLDWTFSDNHFGSGLPPKGDNGALWPLMKPLLGDAAIKPTPADIRFTRDAFLDLLKIRASTALLRLRSAEEVQARLTFLNTGAAQVPTTIVGHLDGRGLPGAGFAELLYAINVAPASAVLSLPELKGRAFRLHPVHRAGAAADPRPATLARWDAASGTLSVPARTALVYVLD
jgi:pullulanase-type alpha-1,6-glucosidase